MTSPGHAEKSERLARHKSYRLVGTAILVAALGLAVLWIKVVRGGQDPGEGVETFAARRGPLTISVLEAGALKAKDPEIIRSSVRRRATILSIVPEGTRVSQGDLLVELDVSEIVDHLVDHKIMVQNAEAWWINAREALVITKSMAQSSVEAAQLKYDFAVLDLKKYLGEGGELATSRAKAEGDITLADQKLKKDTDYYEWSRKLAAEKYLSSTQLQADELSMKQSEYSLKVAQNSLRLLEEYNSQRQLKQLESDVNQAAAALGRAKAKAHANIVQGEALLAARAQELEHQKEMLARHEEEVRGSKVYAPVDGTVIYATSRGGGFHDERKPLADGVDVWERQELIYLQKSSSTIAEVGLHEVNLQKVRVGMPAVVSVDALPGRKLMGTITRIAPLADSQSMWMNPDLKIYKTEITLDVNDPELRSGMNCRAEIVVEQHADAIYVPVQSVRRVAGQPTVYVLHDDGQVEERKIEIGWDDNRMVRVIRGLAQDEPVLLTPPGKAGPEPGLHRTIRGADANDMMQQIREKLQAANGPAPGVRRPQGSGPGPLRTQ